ncbi:hypothetical protein KJ682_01955 [bacterium]|nr:hypothetical protein [bacterium]
MAKSFRKIAKQLIGKAYRREQEKALESAVLAVAMMVLHAAVPLAAAVLVFRRRDL